MAVSGLILLGWSTLHVMGNLLVFGGAALIDGYAVQLRASGVLLPVRLLLVAALVTHVVAAVRLSARSRGARSERYRRPLEQAPRASRSMRWGGVALGLFLLYHLAHIYGPLHPDFVSGGVFHNLVVGMREPLAALIYCVATLLFGAHVAHGASSAVTSLGGPLGGRGRAAGLLLAVALTLGFLAPVGFSLLGGR